MKRYLSLVVALCVCALTLTAVETFNLKEYDASVKGFGNSSEGILDPDGGSISFKFTGKFDRFGQEKYNLYMLFYSGEHQLGIQQLSEKTLRLFFHPRDENKKSFGMEKVVKIIPGKPFTVKAEWGKAGTKLYFDGKIIGSSKLTSIPWARNFMIGGMSSGGKPIRVAGGVFENIVITDSQKAETASAATPTYTRDEYDATEKCIYEDADGVLNPDGGTISFKFTGKFDRFERGKENLYMLFYSGAHQLGIHQLSEKTLRLFFHPRDKNKKSFGMEKVVKIIPGKPFTVKAEWGKTGTRLYFDGRLIGSSKLTSIPWGRKFAIGGMSSGGKPLRLADGKFENFVITDTTTAASGSGMAEIYSEKQLDAPGESINAEMLSGAKSGEISFEFTGNFSRALAPGKINTYPFFRSGRTELGINQLSNGKLRLFFHHYDDKKPLPGCETVVPVAAGKTFKVRLTWAKGEGKLYLDGRLLRKFPMESFCCGSGFRFGGYSGRTADGVMTNISVKTATETETPANETAGVSDLRLDFESGDLAQWRLDKAEGSEQKFSLDTVNAFSGKSSLRVEKTNFAGDFEIAVPTASRAVVKKGETYQLSLRYRLESLTDANISALFKLEDKKGRVSEDIRVMGPGRRALRAYQRHESMLPEHSWREFTVRYKASRDGFLRFAVTGGDGVFKCNFDDVTVKKFQPSGNRIFFEDFSTLNINSADALISRDFIANGVKLEKVKKGLKINFPGNFMWKTARLNPLVEYRMIIDSANVAPDTVVTLVFRDAGDKVLARYERPLAPPCFLDFEVPSTASLATLTVSSNSGSAIIRSVAVDKNFTVNRERAIYNNEWQGYALWDGIEKGKAVIRRTFTLDAAPQEAYIRFLGHNGAKLFVNGSGFGNGGQFAPGVADVTPVLKSGKNTLALLVSCSSGGKKAMFELFVRDVNGKEYFIVSDDKSKVFSGVPSGKWSENDFDDSAWAFAGIRDGSARDFGNGGTAAIVNNRREDLYIGPRELLNVSKKSYSDKFPADGVMNIALQGDIPEEVTIGRVIFTQGNRRFRLELAPQEIKFDRKNLNIAFAPMFMPPGKYECFLELYRIRFKDGIYLKLGDVTIGAKEKPFKRPVAVVKQSNGKSTLFINGKPHPSGMYCTGRPYCPEVRQMNDWVGIKVHQIYINMKATQPFIHNADLIDDGSGNYDFSITEQVLIDAAAQLRHDPDAYIVPLICNGMPKNFAKDPALQGDLMLTGKGYKLWLDGPKRLGKVGHPYRDMSEVPDRARVSISHASKLKTQMYTDLIRATVEYFEKSPISEKIIGYGISGEMDNQLYPYIPYGGYAGQLGRGDYSAAMLRYFRDFLKKRYVTVEALRAAWQNKEVTFETAQIPSDAERAGANFFVNRAVADYVAAFGWAQLDLTNAMTKTIKDATGGRCLTWLYPSDSAGISGAMHYGYHGICVSTGYYQYNSKSVDMFGNPGNYNLRRNGLSSAQYGAPGSAHLGNKIWSPEMDLRSFCIGAYATTWGPDTLFASQSHWAKEMMTTLRHGAGFRIYTFWPGWLNNAGIMDEVALLQNMSRRQLEMPIRWKPEVCLLIDTAAIEHTGDFTERDMHFFLGATGGFLAAELSTSGTQFDIFYLQDILKDEFPVDQYKVFVFGGTHQISGKLLEAVHNRLHSKGKTLLWRWGDGYLDKYNNLSAAAVEELTGFKVKPFQVPGKMLPLAMVNKEVAPYTSGMKGSTVSGRYRYNVVPALPYFTLDDPQAKILANFTSGEPVLGVKKVRGATSIYAALPAIPSRMIRNIYRAAGVHTYVNNDHDFVSTDGNFLSLHSGVGGKKTVCLPEKVAQVKDLHSGKIVAENSNVLRFDLRANGTALFEIIR